MLRHFTDSTNKLNYCNKCVENEYKCWDNYNFNMDYSLAHHVSLN